MHARAPRARVKISTRTFGQPMLIQSYFGKLFRQCSDLTETFLKLFNKLVVRVLSHIKYSAARRVLYCDKTLLLVY